eukprot:PhF_6_TR646/c1_g1_i5/m.911
MFNTMDQRPQRLLLKPFKNAGKSFSVFTYQAICDAQLTLKLGPPYKGSDRRRKKGLQKEQQNIFNMRMRSGQMNQRMQKPNWCWSLLRQLWKPCMRNTRAAKIRKKRKQRKKECHSVTTKKKKITLAKNKRKNCNPQVQPKRPMRANNVRMVMLKIETTL